MLEDIRLTDAEVQEGITPNFVKAQGGTWGLCSFERKLADTATDKAIKTIVEDIEFLSIDPTNTLTTLKFRLKLSEYLEALKKLVI